MVIIPEYELKRLWVMTHKKMLFVFEYITVNINEKRCKIKWERLP